MCCCVSRLINQSFRYYYDSSKHGIQAAFSRVRALIENEMEIKSDEGEKNSRRRSPVV